MALCVKALGIHFSHDKKLKEKMNFGKIVPEMEKIIAFWKQRNLSIYGKIVLIKSLILSKLTYKASMLPVPPEIVKMVNSLIFKFLWSGPDKVKRNVVTNDYDLGGIRMTHLESMIKSLKLSWISRLLSDEDNKPWKMYLQTQLNKVGGVNMFLRCNFDLKNQENLFNVSDFYKEVLSYWQDIKTCNKKLSEELLWNNRDITIGDRPVFYKDFNDVGIKYINHLFIRQSSNDAFQYWQSNGLSRNMITYFKWLGLRSAVIYKRNVMEYGDNVKEYKENPIFIYCKIGKEMNVALLKAKNFYDILLGNKIIQLPTMSTRLKEDFVLDDEMIKLAYILPYKLTKELKIREFQYKVLNFLINTNFLLMKKIIKLIDICDFCHTASETMYHLFYHCNKVYSFWEGVKSYWKIKTNQNWIPTLKNIIIGDVSFPDLLNLIVILGKYYIYKCKLEQTIPFCSKFKKMLVEKYQFEKYLSEKQNLQDKFKSRWTFEP